MTQEELYAQYIASQGDPYGNNELDAMMQDAAAMGLFVTDANGMFVPSGVVDSHFEAGWDQDGFYVKGYCGEAWECFPEGQGEIIDTIPIVTIRDGVPVFTNEPVGVNGFPVQEPAGTMSPWVIGLVFVGLFLLSKNTKGEYANV